jgi:putative transposase
LGTGLHEYFNGKTGRTGHLFDNRYSRVAVESDTQAVQLLDYIHLNPVKGALDSLEAYRWSSYKAYQLGYDPFDICDAAPMLDVVGGSRRYCEHLKKVGGRIWSVEVLPRRRIPDEEALSVAREVLPSIDPALLKALPRPERDACLLRLRRAHLTVKQIARITGIGATSVTKATAGWKDAA